MLIPVTFVTLSLVALTFVAFAFVSIDGRDNSRLGRYVNDAPRRLANCVAKVAFLHGQPRVLLFAAHDIMADTELRYDYGLKDLPWRQVVTSRYINYVQ